jgi:excinuclease ABC subunit A
MMEKPDVDHISGLSPAISIEQKTTSKNPRSTVGTVTEIYDYLRLLFARAGTPYSPATGLPIEAQQVQDMVDRVMAMEEGTRAYLLAPIVRDRKGEYRKEFLELRKQGFQRVKVDGEFYELDEPPTLDKKFRHDIDVVVDRIVVREGRRRGWPTVPHRARPRRRHRDPGDRPGRGRPRAHHLLRELRLPGQRLHHPRDRAAAVLLQRALRRLPGLRRAGGGAVLRRTPHGARRGAQLEDGAIAPWRKGKSPYFLQTIEAIAKHYGFDPRPWKDLPEGAAGLPARLRRGGNPVPLRRGRPRLPGETQLRGRDPEHGAPLSRDR